MERPRAEGFWDVDGTGGAPERDTKGRDRGPKMDGSTMKTTKIEVAGECLTCTDARPTGVAGRV